MGVLLRSIQKMSQPTGIITPMPKPMKVKAPNPVSKLPCCDQDPIIKFYFEFNHLKNLFRQGWIAHGIPVDRCESVAEHSFGVAVIAMLLADKFFPELDTQKIFQMALIHDFGEVYAGDIIPNDKITPAKKRQLEKQSIQRVFEPLSNGEKFISIWEEFEEGNSPEAQFVRQIDKLEMAFQASVYEHQQTGQLIEFFHSAGAAISTPQLTSILNELKELR